MKTKTLNATGSLHPVIFFIAMYVIALLLSVFICSSLFYSCNMESGKVLSASQKSPSNLIPR
ncbi:MAG: hypothetical protein JST23_13530 [Bacteroidetes bacterium]|nr:hypothetical protein [Bacteroidota bacterium]